MRKRNKISVVIPCHNEERGIELTLGRIPKFVDEVVVVDNSSADRTAVVAKKLGARVISEAKKGYGFALKSGIAAASGDIVITVDGDATYPVEDIKQPLDYLIAENLDFVSCSRFPLRNHSSMHWQNLIGNKLLSFLMKVLFLRDFKDGLSGMWVFKKSIYRYLIPLSSGWNISEEIKLKAYLHPKIKFDEYRINYHPRYGRSHIWPLAVGLQNILYLVYLRIHGV